MARRGIKRALLVIVGVPTIPASAYGRRHSHRRSAGIIGRHLHSARLSQTQGSAHFLTNAEYEIEFAGETIASVRYMLQQFVLEEAVTEVRRLVGKIELRGQ